MKGKQNRDFIVISSSLNFYAHFFFCLSASTTRLICKIPFFFYFFFPFFGVGVAPLGPEPSFVSGHLFAIQFVFYWSPLFLFGSDQSFINSKSTGEDRKKGNLKQFHDLGIDVLNRHRWWNHLVEHFKKKLGSFKKCSQYNSSLFWSTCVVETLFYLNANYGPT